MFCDESVFPDMYKRKHLQPINAEDKHDECDYETENEHVTRAQELMLEDLRESIKFFVSEQPLDLVHNVHMIVK